MKKLLTLTAVGAMLTAPAIAVQKCVAFDSEITTCTSEPELFKNKLDWVITCTTNGVRVPFTGIAICNDGNEYNAGEFIDEQYDLMYSSYSGGTDMVSCLCRVYEPVVSYAVSAGIFSSYGDCVQNCEYKCASTMAENGSWPQEQMFSHINRPRYISTIGR